EEVQRIQRGREEVLVYVRYPDQARQSLLALDEFRVRLPDGASVPLNTVAEATESRAYSVIERVDGRRVVTVEAAIDSKLNTPGNANADLIARVVPELEKAYPGLVIVQSGDTRERSEEMAAMAQSFFIVVIVIFAVVATQLRSYLQPLAILIAIPIAVSGALLGHLVLGYAVSFVSIFGIIALAGVSINASVVLLDLYNKQRREGVPSVEAATRASVRRFRPVLLTTLTTALGLAPLLMETSPQAQFLMPMAVSLGFGIVISGFMVVLVTPAVALIIEDIQLLPQRIRSLMSGSQGAASAPVSAE
ncbi:MAG: efflux RND transporter permease subunit, partial [Pseudomonadota bacterium]